MLIDNLIYKIYIFHYLEKRFYENEFFLNVIIEHYY